MAQSNLLLVMIVLVLIGLFVSMVYAFKAMGEISDATSPAHDDARNAGIAGIVTFILGIGALAAYLYYFGGSHKTELGASVMTAGRALGGAW